jgi:hypothetical protein
VLKNAMRRQNALVFPSPFHWATAGSRLLFFIYLFFSPRWSCLPSSDFGFSTGWINQQYWEMSKWYFVNVERANIADKLQPRNINVSFNNNSNVAFDVIIFIFYSDQLVIDVETGIVTEYFFYNIVMMIT